ncbi:hypothetical protein [Solimicrobium silvestre]|uniref:Uncharacterized protein n=1 Tax=Solimicrobium silvestre TaxID=2099400 RepID=A0A2S9H2F1_9BURK|nr:hypothetical protein [Solimicrobium silvestre]PRC94165.1 hypothetical protein S2091_1338 [Solimicrobium silvestre]
MTPKSNLRSLVCLSFVVLLHVVIISMWHLRNNFHDITSSELRYLQYVSIAQPRPRPISTPNNSPTVKSQPNKTTKSAVNTESTTAPITEPQAISSTPSNEPRLDLDALRASAVQQELHRTRSPIEKQQEANLKNQSLEARVEDAANKAQRPDCRTAYAGGGLLAPIGIAIDLIRDKGCKF